MNSAMGAGGLSTQELGVSSLHAQFPDRGTLSMDSPTNSEGTEFFDAHEEISWTSEHLVGRSPLTRRVQREENQMQHMWVVNDHELRDVREGSSFDQQKETTGSIWSPIPNQVEKSESLRYLFPSKDVMLRSEHRRSSAASQASISVHPPSPHRATSGPGYEAQPRERDADGGLQYQVDDDSQSTTGTLGMGEKESSMDEDDEHGGDETSTASGTLTEGGWESNHGFDTELMEEQEQPTNGAVDIEHGRNGVETTRRVEREGEGSLDLAPKGNSLRKVLHRARTRHVKMMGMGRGRTSRPAEPPAASPTFDSGSVATSPDDQGPEASTRILSGGDSSQSGHSLGKAAGALGCRRRRESKSSGGGAGDGPPEIKVQQHGRGGAKEDGWRSMHMIQCIRYHKGPVWTVEFNRDGSLMATGGEDTKVAVWKVLRPGEETYTNRNGITDGAGSSEKARGHQQGEEFDENSSGELKAGSGEEDVGRTPASTDITASESASSASSSSDDIGPDGRLNAGLGPSGKRRILSGSKVFGSEPIRVYSGHKSDVVDLSWSHSDFLCSASIDYTVMLWHRSREERLGTFMHPDFVTAVQFHPLDDSIFLTGCFDKRLRLWTIPEGRVVDWAQCQDMISAANFSPDGQLTAAGLYDGRVMFYHTASLQYYTQIHCRNRHGSNRRGKKVTGLAFVETAQLRHLGPQEPGDSSSGRGAVAAEAGATSCNAVCSMPASGTGGLIDGQLRGGKASSMSAQYSLLSTTNDSRLRVYDLDNFAMTNKFKGLVNDKMQIKATFSEDGKFVICGSEDGEVYIWNSTQRSRRKSSQSVVGAPASGCAIASSAPPAATAGRVKSRTSSSFSVQCSVRPQVATVATFLPTNALKALLEESGDHGTEGACSRVDDGFQGGSSTGPRRRVRWRAKGLRRLSLPATSQGGRATVRSVDDVDGAIGRRRWSFAGNMQARFGGSGSIVGRSCRSQKKSTNGSSTGDVGRELRLSLSPKSRRQEEHEYNRRRSPGASFQCHSSRRADGATAFWGSTHGPSATSTRSGVKRVAFTATGARAVVTADYSGEIKVFLGYGEAPLS